MVRIDETAEQRVVLIWPDDFDPTDFLQPPTNYPPEAYGIN